MSPTNWWCQIISTTHNKLLNAYIKSTLPAVIETIVVFHFFHTFQPHVIINYNYCLSNKMEINNILLLNFSHLPTACTVTQNTYRPISKTFYSNHRRHADRLEKYLDENTDTYCFIMFSPKTFSHSSKCQIYRVLSVWVLFRIYNCSLLSKVW